MPDLDHKLMTPPSLALISTRPTPAGDQIAMWHLRISSPNIAHIPTEVVHSFEHFLIYTLAEASDSVIGAAPMGCQTGFYIFAVNLSAFELMADLVANALEAITRATEVPYANTTDCGWADNHSLNGAQDLAAWLLRHRDTWSQATTAAAAAEPAKTIGVTRTDASAALLDRAATVTPGGVNSMRRRIDPPLCPERGMGAYIQDVDGNRYLDFHAAYGAIVLGHSYPTVTRRVREILDRHILFGVGTTRPEVLLAEKLVEHVPSVEQALICNTGTEATFYAIRLARAATGRTKLVKFQGHYHGFHDYVLRNTISEPEMIGKRDPNSAGMLPAAVDATLICRYNDLESVRQTFAEHGDDIAAIIVEPIAHNSPSILPAPGFLAGLREICDQHGAVLIFDEVITGFRHSLSGYQAAAGVTPDVTTFGKAIANGYTVAALGGRRDLMEHFNTTRTGDVTYGGTHNGGGVGVAAALATIEVMETEPVHEHTFALGDQMRAGLREIAKELDVPAVVSGYGSLYVMLFMDGPLNSYDDVPRNDKDFFVAYRKELVRRGVLEMPENIGRNHISYSHTTTDIERALDISRDALRTTVHTRGLPNTR